METGETDQALNVDLIFGWDGHVLRWLAAEGRQIQAFGEAADAADWKEIALRYRNAKRTIATRLFPVMSLMPTAVARGFESEVLALHHGDATEAQRSFLTDRLGEGLSLIESGHGESIALLDATWPTSRWVSATLGWLEHQGLRALQQTAQHGGSYLSIAVGDKRALLSRFDAGKLAWCTVTEDLDGTGVLYHCVNAMVRDGLDVEGGETAVELSGPTERISELSEQFGRFFKHVQTADSPWDWGAEQPDRPDRWDLLYHARR